MKNKILSIIVLFILINSTIAETVYFEVLIGNHSDERAVVCLKDGETNPHIIHRDRYLIDGLDQDGDLILCKNKRKKNKNINFSFLDEDGNIKTEYNYYLQNLERVVAYKGGNVYFISDQQSLSQAEVHRVDFKKDEFIYRLSDFTTYDNVSISLDGYLYYRGIIAYPNNEKDIYVKDYLPNEYVLDTDALSSSYWIDNSNLYFWARKKGNLLTAIMNQNKDSYLMRYDVNNNTVKPVTTIDGELICIDYDVICSAMYVTPSLNFVYVFVAHNSSNFYKDMFILQEHFSFTDLIRIDLQTGSYMTIWESEENAVPRISQIIST